jgi:hypothetical protein
MKATRQVVVVCVLALIPVVASASPLPNLHVPSLSELLSSVFGSPDRATAPTLVEKRPAQHRATHRRIVVSCAAGSQLDPNGNCIGG